MLVPSPDPNDYEPYSLRYAYDTVGKLISNGEYSSGPLKYKSERVDLFNGDGTEAGTLINPSDGNFQYDANGNTVRTPWQNALAYTHDRQLKYIDLGGGRVRYSPRRRQSRAVRDKNGVRALTAYLARLNIKSERDRPGTKRSGAASKGRISA